MAATRGRIGGRGFSGNLEESMKLPVTGTMEEMETKVMNDPV